MAAKYVTEDRAKGRKVWRFKPKKHVRAALAVKSKTFYSLQEATSHSNTVLQAYEDYKRTLSTDVTINPTTVDGLIAYYFTTTAFTDLKPRSQAFYRLCLGTACATFLEQGSKPFGRYLFKGITTSSADKLKRVITEQVSEHRSQHAMKCLRRVWYIGMRHDKVSSGNPFFKMGIKTLERRQKRWTDEEISKFVKVADEHGYHGLATLVVLCWHMCQRPGDMRQLTWDNIIDGQIVFTQEKTGTRLSIPMTPAVAERLKKTKFSEKTECIVYYSKTGKAYDRRLYNSHAAKVRKLAGLDPDLKVADLRRTGATEMANAGCTDDEMRSVTGHKTRDVLGIYLVLDSKTATNALNKRFSSSPV